MAPSRQYIAFCDLLVDLELANGLNDGGTRRAWVFCCSNHPLVGVIVFLAQRQ